MKTKILILSLVMVMISLPLLAQTGIGEIYTGINIGTYSGIVAVISMCVTQIAKRIPVIEMNNWLKIICSVVVGIIICSVIKAVGIHSALIDNLSWVQTICIGGLAGLSGSGIYDLIKAFFGKDKD